MPLVDVVVGGSVEVWCGKVPVGIHDLSCCRLEFFSEETKQGLFLATLPDIGLATA